MSFIKRSYILLDFWKNRALDQIVHPYLIENATTESLVKMLKFGIWVDYQMRLNKSSSQEDVVRRELAFYQNTFPVKTEAEEITNLDLH